MLKVQRLPGQQANSQIHDARGAKGPPAEADGHLSDSQRSSAHSFWWAQRTATWGIRCALMLGCAALATYEPVHANRPRTQAQQTALEAHGFDFEARRPMF